MLQLICKIPPGTQQCKRQTCLELNLLPPETNNKPLASNSIEWNENVFWFSLFWHFLISFNLLFHDLRQLLSIIFRFHLDLNFCFMRNMIWMSRETRAKIGNDLHTLKLINNTCFCIIFRSLARAPSGGEAKAAQRRESGMSSHSVNQKKLYMKEFNKQIQFKISSSNHPIISLSFKTLLMARKCSKKTLFCGGWRGAKALFLRLPCGSPPHFFSIGNT